MAQDSRDLVPMSVKWQLDFSTPPVPTNQLLVQFGPPTGSGSERPEVQLVFGYLASPVVLAGQDGARIVYTPEDGTLPVLPVGNFVLTFDRLVEFRDVLSTWIESEPTPSMVQGP